MATADQQELIGIIAVSHCNLAEEMLCAAALITGPLLGCKALSFEASHPVEEMT